MQDSKFWRIVAVVICGGIFYVGHGLHNSSSEPLPSFVDSARAGGVGVDAPGTSLMRTWGRLYTTDETGTYLYVWDASDMRALPKFLATLRVPHKHIFAPQEPEGAKK
jgi:hypothetical protein